MPNIGEEIGLVHATGNTAEERDLAVRLLNREDGADEMLLMLGLSGALS